ncbi:MAG: transglutaminase domain-containing protein [Thermotogota bacterium]|nr:transglutaminase domain-containing protein [Thermotogota bacterium]
MVRTIIITCVIAMATGCGMLTTKVYIPQKTHVEQIEWVTKGDCCVKAKKGQILFNRNGIQSKLCCGYVGVTGNFAAHCWNEVWYADDQQWHLIDLHDRIGSDGWPRDQYIEYVTTSIWYGIPTLEEIRNDKNADWYFQGTIGDAVRQLPRGK